MITCAHLYELKALYLLVYSAHLTESDTCMKKVIRFKYKKTHKKQKYQTNSKSCINNSSMTILPSLSL